MIFRVAEPADTEQMQRVRLAVRENVLSDPSRIRPADTQDFITRRGRGWVCERQGEILGFSVVDLSCNNVWALFVDPSYEGQRIGRELHDLMLAWYFEQTETTLWLSTGPGTRAEGFYRRAGWVEAGFMGNGSGREVRFEMTLASYFASRQSRSEHD